MINNDIKNTPMEKNKKLSIITINRNNGDGLRQTLASVACQTSRHSIEHIVIDGASTDNSVDVLNEYSDRLDYWISEVDKGIYNAMNKGTQIATGEYCLYLNSGDCLASSDVIERVLGKLDRDIVCGRVKIVNGKMNRDCIIPPKIVTANLMIRDTLPHPSSFIKRALLLKRPYDESMKICADWRFFFDTFFYDDITYKSISDLITNFDANGISSTMPYTEKFDYLERTVPPGILKELKALPNELIGIYTHELENGQGVVSLMVKLNRIFATCYKVLKKIH